MERLLKAAVSLEARSAGILERGRAALGSNGGELADVLRETITGAVLLAAVERCGLQVDERVEVLAGELPSERLFLARADAVLREAFAGRAPAEVVKDVRRTCTDWLRVEVAA